MDVNRERLPPGVVHIDATQVYQTVRDTERAVIRLSGQVEHLVQEINRSRTEQTARDSTVWRRLAALERRVWAWPSAAVIIAAASLIIGITQQGTS